MSRISGHLAKKGNRWYVVLNLRDPATGKRRKKWISTGLTRKRDAEDELVRILGEHNDRTYIDPNTVTVGQVLNVV